MYLDYLEWKRVNKIDEIVINPDGPIPCPIRGFTRIKDQNPIPQNKNEGKVISENLMQGIDLTFFFFN